MKGECGQESDAPGRGADPIITRGGSGRKEGRIQSERGSVYGVGQRYLAEPFGVQLGQMVNHPLCLRQRGGGAG